MVARLPEHEYIWPSFAGMCRAHQLVIVPESVVTIAFAGRRLPSSCATTWGLHRRTVVGIARQHQFPPFRHPGLCAVEEAPVLFTFEQRKKRFEGSAGIADQCRIHRITERDPGGIPIDLHTLCLAGFRIKFDIRKSRAYDQERIATLHRLLRRFCTQQADATGSIRAVVGDAGFAKQRFDNRPAQFFGRLSQQVAGVECSLPGQDCYFPALIENRRRRGEVTPRRQLRALRVEI